MCPGKRSFWTSLAVSPFQEQSRGPRWLSPFDFGKTSSPLPGNFTYSPVQTVSAELKVKNHFEKCQTAQERIQAAPGAAPPGENSQEISGKRRIKPCSFFCCGESRVKQVHRQAKKHRHTEAFLLSWLFTFPNTAPCASNSDTMTPHVVRLEPNFALSCSLSGDLYRRWVSCPLLRFIVAIPQIPAVGLSKPFSRTICAHSGMLLSKSV